ncbi:hypothetical protein LXM94_16025 [Rhizobium sp. TRM95111]|uniref:hypothetical protein n=1 Tax=Rhizobium alarense TaxID=2846851 RepID=UPI001F248FE0|nr:hypothetical protein [Rhizobium alarense]MCF3641481.1 hypothetical protein [Rhizobium alarense]
MTPKTNVPQTHLISVAEMAGVDAEAIADHFVCENWTADLSTGLIALGPQALAMHDLARAPCGIMTMINVYDRADRAKILAAFEEACGMSTAFTFATTICVSPGIFRPVFCTGESDTSQGGSIRGLFAFSRLCLDTNGGRARILN